VGATLFEPLASRRCSIRRSGSTLRVIGLPSLEHRDEHGEQTVGNAPKRSAVTVAGGSEPGVLLLAARVMLHAGPGPMIQSISQSRIAAIAHADLLTLAALSGDGSDAAVSTDVHTCPDSTFQRSRVRACAATR
jgi:hypothetical protein